jgi:hypothetical protein
MTDTETIAEAWRRRTARPGAVDFTMMYVAHDAFARDLARLLRAAQQGRAGSPAARATWAMFSRQLHTHHRAEDASLWPKVRAVDLDAQDLAVLEAMEDEHARLDPLLARIDTAIEAGSAPAKAELAELANLLGGHMRHEEEAALPIVERRIGAAGWAAFGQEIRRAQGGLKAGRAYLTWVLDGAPEPARAAVLAVLPAPVRLLLRRVWEPAYRRSVRLT